MKRTPEESAAIMKAEESLRNNVAELAKELPGVTFGYLGNCGTSRYGWFDDRCWMIFLPHPGRVGEFKDAVHLGSTNELPGAAARWVGWANMARKQYHDGSERVHPIFFKVGDTVLYANRPHMVEEMNDHSVMLKGRDGYQVYTSLGADIRPYSREY